MKTPQYSPTSQYDKLEKLDTDFVKLNHGLITEIIKSLQGDIEDDFKDEEDEEPHIDFTLGIGDNNNWSWQSGDNSYTGGAYSYPHWGVVSITRNANPADLASEVIDEALEIRAQANL